MNGVMPKPFNVAIFCGYSKLESVQTFLHDVLEDLGHLADEGITIGDKKVRIFVKGFICDAPPRAFVKCVKGHCGFSGCERCMQNGIYMDRKVVFIETQ